MKIQAVLFAVLTLVCIVKVDAQEIQRKNLNALRIFQPLVIDGILDEDLYNTAEIASDFVQLMPHNGQPCKQKTEVKVLYDNEAIYIGAMLYDNPDSIANFITTRDVIGVSDYFLVALDPNNEGMLMYEFVVTPANSQIDLKGSRGNGYDSEDPAWNAVWESATKILDNGWSVEMKIPYSAIRFAEEENPVWAVNFFRRIRRYNSNNSWNLVNMKISGWLHQSGQLHGLKDITPPLRLSLTPYLAQYAERKSTSAENEFVLKGGMDLKLGISKSHTIDMMLIPDFGQIQSDDEQLNLTPYEVYYDEKRQFFTEGSELFGRAEIFYSRRIGAKPIFSDEVVENVGENEELTFNPSQTQLVNATKISGKNKNGWGIGVLNAMTLPAKASIENKETGAKREVISQPFTNYNIAVVEKSMRNNSFVSVINSNLSMLDNSYHANVTASQFQLKNRKQTHQISGLIGGSYKSLAENKTGYGYGIDLSKIKGNFRYGGGRSVFSDNLDINDLGYLRRNNIIDHKLWLGYFIFDPFSIFNNWSLDVSYYNTSLFKPTSHISDKLSLWTDATFKNNWWLGVNVAYNFGENDFFEPRSDNHRYYKMPEHYSTDLNFRTDQNKKLSFDMNTGLYSLPEKGRWGNWLGSGLWWKVSARFNMEYSTRINNELDAEGFVELVSDDEIYFGTYDRRTYENTYSLSYTFNTKLAVDLRARHYWSFADYEDDFFLLSSDGSLTEAPDFINEADVNFNAFNIDMIIKWEFAPGSELSLAWKHAIYNSNTSVNQSLQKNIRNLFDAEKFNNLSLKVLYYIDYNALFRK